MTVKEARSVFAHMMKVSRERSLTEADRKKLRTASQIIRHAKRTTAATNKPPVLKKRGRKTNPSRVLIYKAITRIEGTKGKDSQFPGQKFFHNFKRPYPKMYGLPDGSLLISSK
jgi:hypothetical protein